jgi:4-oxalocrotonate tautomerase family enzyme
VTDVVAEALECPKDAVKIVIREMEHDHYSVAGIPWSDNKEQPYKL